MSKNQHPPAGTLADADADGAVDDDLDEVTPESVEEVRAAARKRLQRIASQVYSVRIPVDRLEDLRALAAARGEAPTALMREWVLERLTAETLNDPAAGTGAMLRASGDVAEGVIGAMTALTEAVNALTAALPARVDPPPFDDDPGRRAVPADNYALGA